MSNKIFVKNLNVYEIEKYATKEFNKINLNLTINQFINEFIANELNINPFKLELLYRGELMDRKKLLIDYLNDLNEVSLILVENKLIDSNDLNEPSEKDIQELSHRIGTTFKSKKKRRQLENFLRNNDNFENICKSIPALEQDPVSSCYIKSYDLIMQLNDFNKAKSLIKNYPNIYEAVKQVYKLVCDEIKNNPINTNFVSKGSYSIDDMSEDEDNTQMAGSSRRTTSTGPSISQDQLSAVLAAINQQQQQQQQQQRPIGRDYFETVMQNLLTQTLTSNTNTPRTQSSSSQPVRQPEQQQQQQQQPQQTLSDETLASCLEQMHAIGLWDDEKNMRALYLTDGNVEAAVSLILEGVDF